MTRNIKIGDIVINSKNEVGKIINISTCFVYFRFIVGIFEYEYSLTLFELENAIKKGEFIRIGAYTFNNSQPKSLCKLDEQEKKVYDALTCAWNEYCNLPIQHPDEKQDFKKAIHDAQYVLMARIARKADPEEFPTKK